MYYIWQIFVYQYWTLSLMSHMRSNKCSIKKALKYLPQINVPYRTQTIITSIVLKEMWLSLSLIRIHLLIFTLYNSAIRITLLSQDNFALTLSF